MQTRRRFLQTVSLAPAVGITHLDFCRRESAANCALAIEGENESSGLQPRSAWDSFVWALAAGAATRDLVKIAERALADPDRDVARDAARFLSAMGRRQGHRR